MKLLDAIAPVVVSGARLRIGLSRYLKKSQHKDWRFGALNLRLPLFPWFARRTYSPATDEFTTGWMLCCLLLQMGRAPIFGVASLQVRTIIGSYQIGAHVPAPSLQAKA